MFYVVYQPLHPRLVLFSASHCKALTICRRPVTYSSHFIPPYMMSEDTESLNVLNMYSISQDITSCPLVVPIQNIIGLYLLSL